MAILDRIVDVLRSSDRRSARAAKAALRTLFVAEFPTTALHRALFTEYQLRRLTLGHLARALYYQPMLRTMCAQSGRRLCLQMGTGLPVFYGVDVELGDGVTVTGWMTVSGAVRGDGRRPRL